MLKYKLTDKNNQTRNNTQWGENVTHETSGEGELCGPGWLHYYHHPLLAILLNPVHAKFTKYNLWVCEAEGEHKDDRGLKAGCTKLTTIKQINAPEITCVQRVAFAILCAKEVCTNENWNKWADKWLSGEDRSPNSAYAIAATVTAANYASDAAYDVTAYDSSIYAYNVGNAACNATTIYNPLDLIKIAKECLKYY